MPDFDESQHPRAADGKFTAGGEGLKKWAGRDEFNSRVKGTVAVADKEMQRWSGGLRGRWKHNKDSDMDSTEPSAKFTQDKEQRKDEERRDRKRDDPYGSESHRSRSESRSESGSADWKDPDAGRLTTEKGKRRWSDTGPKNLPEFSWQGHYDKDPEEGGKPTEERRKNVIEPIMHEFLDKVQPVGPGEQKVAIFTMGGPGSGKSSMTASADKTKFVHIDPDEIRVRLPEYKQAVNGPITYRYAAAMTHPEASQMAKDMTKLAMQQNKNVIIDGTGINPNSISKKMDQLRAAGYHIHLAYAHLGETAGVNRVKTRAESSGRYVGEDIVRDAYRNIPNNFQKIASKADTWAVHDTLGKGAPVVWKKGEDGKEQVADEDFVRGFRDTFGKKEETRKPGGPRQESLFGFPAGLTPA